MLDGEFFIATDADVHLENGSSQSDQGSVCQSVILDDAGLAAAKSEMLVFRLTRDHGVGSPGSAWDAWHQPRPLRRLTTFLVT